MANQVSLLGLSNLPQKFTRPPDQYKTILTTTTALTPEQIKTLTDLFPQPLPPENKAPGDDAEPKSDATDSKADDAVFAGRQSSPAAPSSVITDNKCGNVLSKLAFLRKKDDSVKLPVLDIVAFTDTNDILSWPIPAAYVGGYECAPLLRIVNVYVQNTTRWFGLAANPGDAHGGYFTNPDVWQLIRCGAAEGKLRTC